LTLDADEQFLFEDNFEMPKLIHDAYYIWTKNNAFEYQRMQCVSDKFDWHYEGVLHEYIDTKDKKFSTIGTIKGMYNKPTPDGARSSDQNKYRKDALIFEQALLDDPKNSRYVFYLAQSYRDCYDYDNAIKNYKKRVEMGGFPEEVFYAQYEVGLCKIRRGDKFEDFIGDLLLAYNLRPQRLEPIHKIVRYCRLNNMARLGYQLCKHVLEKPLITNDILFVERSVFDYKLLDELAVCAYWAGYYQVSIDLNNRLLKENKIPNDMINRINKNLELSEEKIKQGFQGPPPKPPSNSNIASKQSLDWNSIDRNNLEQVFTEIINKNHWGYNGQK
jgi:tetratricopeptide (TPR) repeat protein